MIRAYNKITHQWTTTEDGSDLTPVDGWVLNPIFDDEERALMMGQEFWTIDGSNITTPTVAEWEAIMKERAKVTKWKEIQEFRDNRIQAGGYKVGEYWFHSDNISRIQQLGLVMLGANMPGGLMWKTMSGAFVQMTPTLAMQIFQAAAASDMMQHAVGEAHRQQMLAQEDPCDYDYINTPPAWPKIYGE